MADEFTTILSPSDVLSLLGGMPTLSADVEWLVPPGSLPRDRREFRIECEPLGQYVIFTGALSLLDAANVTLEDIEVIEFGHMLDPQGAD